MSAENEKIRLFNPHRFNARGRARFSRNRTAALTRHIGREPSYPEQIIMARAVALEWELRKLDARIDAGEELSAHALRARLAAENRLRLDLVAIGLRDAAATQPKTLVDHIRANRAAARRGAL